MDSGYFKYLFAGAVTILGTVLLFFLLTSIHGQGDRKKQRRIDISKLEPGHFFAIDTETLRYYVMRPQSDVYVLGVPVDDNTIPMPEAFWWQPLMRCKDFGLDSAGDAIAHDAHFRCRDAGQPSEWAARWQWDIYGRHVPDNNSKISDFYRVRIERSRDEIVLLALETE